MRLSLRSLAKNTPKRRISSIHQQQTSIQQPPSILTTSIRLASPIATSSKITLDHPLHLPLSFTLPYFPSSGPTSPDFEDSQDDQQDGGGIISQSQSQTQSNLELELDIESRIEDPPLPLMLTFASDEELVKALFSPPLISQSSISKSSTNSTALTKLPGSQKIKSLLTWTSTLDPALAYLALRSRHSFTPFLRDLTTDRIEEIYNVLKSSGLNQRLVTDLLLRYPEPSLLCKILDLDSNNYSTPIKLKRQMKSNPENYKTLKVDRTLRPSIVSSIYSILPSNHRSTISRRTNLHISRAMISQSEITLIPSLFHNLSKSTTWVPEGTWILLNLILELVRHQSIDEAIPLLHNLVANDRLPKSALSGKGLSSHPEAKTLIVQTLILRTTLEWKFYGRSKKLALEIVETLKRSYNSESVWNLILEVVRVALVGGKPDDLNWIRETLTKMATIPQPPQVTSTSTSTSSESNTDSEPPKVITIPSPITNTYLASIRHFFPPEKRFFKDLPNPHRPKLTISNFMRLAEIRDRRILYLLIEDIKEGRLEMAGFDDCKTRFEDLLTNARMDWWIGRARKAWGDEVGCEGGQKESLGLKEIGVGQS